MQRSDFVNLEGFELVLSQLGVEALIAVSPKNVFYYSRSPTARIHVRNRFWPRSVGPVLPVTLVTAGVSTTLLVSHLDEAVSRNEAWAKEVRTYRAFVESPMSALGNAVTDQGLGRSRLGYEAEAMAIAEVEMLRRLLPDAELVPADQEMEWIRSVKTARELEQMKLAADRTDEAIFDGFSSARVGDTEWEIHSRIIAGVLARGGELCRGLFQAGTSNNLTFGGTGHKRLEWGDIVHIDYAAYYDGYPANLSRIGIMGEPSPEQEKRYGDLLTVHRKVMAFMKPGIVGSSVFWYCRSAFKELGYTHTAAIVGHNLGLGYHDRPMITAAETMPLEPNNVVALEPLIEWAYHIQDQVVVTPSGGMLQSDKFDTSQLFVMGGRA